LISSKILTNAERIQADFQSALPFKHVYLRDFLEPEAAEALLRDFPVFNRAKAINEYGEVGRKAVNTKLADISPFYRRFYDYLFSEKFLGAMSAISGISDLMGDETLYGGGTHENLNGQELDPHVDFNYVNGGAAHRRMNLLIYLNKGWNAEWGGAIELHSNPRDPDTNKISAYSVDFNKALLFETNEYSWHGFTRVSLPVELIDSHSRKCLSIYLYTKTRPVEEMAGTHATFYVQRPLSSRFKAGYQLNERDVQELVANYRGRDRYIEYYQKQEERFGRRLKQLDEFEVAHSSELQLPLLGYARPLSLRTGHVWPDGWASKHFSVDLMAVRPLRRMQLRVIVPDSAPAGNRQFSVEAAGTHTVFQSSGHGSFTFGFPLHVPAGKSFSLTVNCEMAFNMAVSGTGTDVRDLAYLVGEIDAQSV